MSQNISPIFFRFVDLVNELGANDILRETDEFKHFQNVIDEFDGVFVLDYSIFNATYEDFVGLEGVFDDVFFNPDVIIFRTLDTLFRTTEHIFRLRGMDEIAERVERCISSICFSIELENFSFESL